MANEERTILLKVELDRSQLEKSAGESEKAIAQITAKMKELKSENQTGTLEYAKLRAELQKHNKNLSDTAKALNAVNDQNKSTTNTLEEMRQRLAAAAIAFAKMDQASNPEAYEKARQQLSDLREEVNNIQKSYGNAVLDVGKYEKATAMIGGTLDEIRAKMDALTKEGLQNSQEFKNLSKAYEDAREEVKVLSGDMEHLGKDIIVEVTGSISKMEDRLYEMALAGDTTSKEFIELQKQTASYKKIILEVDASIDALAESGGALGSALQLGEGLVSGYQALTGATALLGGENEALLETLTKLEAAQAVLSSLESAQLAIRRNSVKFTQLQAGAQNLLNKALGNGTTAAKAFRGALLATGVGAIVVGVIALIENFDALKKMMGGTVDVTEQMNAGMDAYRDAAAGAIVETTKVEAAFKLAKDGVISKEEALQTYNDTLGDSFGEMTNLTDAEQVFIDKKDAFIQATADRAMAIALFEEAAKLQAESFTAATEDNVSTWDRFTSSFSQGLNIATQNSEAFYKREKELQAAALTERQNDLQEKVDILLKEGSAKLLSAETTENANGIISESDRKLADARKKQFEDWKKNHAEYIKGAEELALTLQDVLTEGVDLTLSQQRKVIEDHYDFLEKAAKNNTDALIQIEQAKNTDLALLEEQEKAQSIKKAEETYQKEVEAATKKYSDLISLAKKTGDDTAVIEQAQADYLVQLESNKATEIDSLEIDFNDRRIKREQDFTLKVEELNDSRAEAIKAALNEIDLAEKELALEKAKGTDDEAKAWQDLQDEKIRQLKQSNAEAVANTEITEQERLAIVAKNELEIQRLRNETYEQGKALDEKRLSDNRALASSFLSTAQGLSDGLYQIAQNQLQTELNDLTSKYDSENELLQAKLDAQLISESEYIAQKSQLDAEQRASEARIKREQWKKDQQAKYISALINTALAVTSALSTQPFLPLGAIAAAAAGLAGGLQVAAIASAPEPKFARGAALTQSGIFGGKSHSNGGVKLSADGVPFGEAEKDELFVIMNKRATAELQQLSEINSRNGGVSFTGNKMARGGLMKFQNGTALNLSAASLSSSAESRNAMENAIVSAVMNAPSPVVLVEDITYKQSNQVEVRSRADV